MINTASKKNIFNRITIAYMFLRHYRERLFEIQKRFNYFVVRCQFLKRYYFSLGLLISMINSFIIKFLYIKAKIKYRMTSKHF